MSSELLGKAGMKLFEKNLDQYAPEDPLYEHWTDERGKKRRRVRELPPGLSARDAKILKSVQKRAHYLDKGFSILGFHFGWTFIIGIIPGAGDVADAVLNYVLVVRKCRQAEIPSWLLRRMLLNNVISSAAGFIPFVGDLVLAMFKANWRNAALLEEFLRIRGAEYLRLQAEGKDATAVTAAAAESLKKQKAKGKGKGGEKEKQKEKEKEEHAGADGITKLDVVRLKPGAGKKSGEVIPVPAVHAPAGGAMNATSTSKSLSSPSNNGARRSSILRWRKRSSSGAASAEGAAKDKGKFVEHIGPDASSTSAAAGDVVAA